MLLITFVLFAAVLRSSAGGSSAGRRSPPPPPKASSKASTSWTDVREAGSVDRQLSEPVPAPRPTPASDARRGPAVRPGDRATPVEEQLGAPPDEVFAAFDDVPLSAASIAQVHACTLQDGREAVTAAAARHHPPHEHRPADPALFATKLSRLNSPSGPTSSGWSRTSTPSPTRAQRSARGPSPVLLPRHIGAFGDNEGITAPEVLGPLRPEPHLHGMHARRPDGRVRPDRCSASTGS